MVLRRMSIITMVFLLVTSTLAVAEPPQGQRSRGGQFGRGRNRAPDKLAEGDKAIDFTLQSLDKKKKSRLSSFHGKKPVALIFGSYT